MEKRQKHSTFSKTLSIILSLIMLLSAMPLTIIGFAEETSYAVGDTIEYGSYPQTEVTDTSVTAQLETLAGSTANWTSYNYMSSTNTVGDYMKYKDVTYNGEKYRGVYFSLYRPYWTTYTASTDADDTYQGDNGYTYGNTYWFKYEPIEWVILEAGTGGLAVCKNILDSQAYCDTYYYNSDDGERYGDSSYSYYCNNWEHSTIRTWLNSTFINTAFTTSQQSNIVETTISTPAYSTDYSEYDSADTSDKVFLLSYTDVQNTEYGFVSGTSSSITRQKTGTDYAKSQGLYVDSDSGCSYWRLRSAGYNSSDTCGVNSDGYVYNYDDTSDTSDGVVAALYFQSYNPAGTSDCVHSYKSTVTAPTCTEKGFTTHTCTKCGDSYVDNFVAALGHKWNSGKVTIATTCNATGVKTYTCTVCKTTKTEPVFMTINVDEVQNLVITLDDLAEGNTYYCKQLNTPTYVEVPEKTYFSDGQSSVTVPVTGKSVGTETLAFQLYNGDVEVGGTAFVEVTVTTSQQYTVTFDTNGGTPASIPDQTVEEHGKIVKPENPTKAGYAFDGWYPESGGAPWDFEENLITDDLTLVAVWKEVPNTGDANNIWLYVLAGVLALGAMGAVVLKKRTGR